MDLVAVKLEDYEGMLCGSQFGKSSAKRGGGEVDRMSFRSHERGLERN